jgi:hypothetical protein
LISESNKLSIRLVIEEFKFSGSKDLPIIGTPNYVSCIPQINDGLRSLAERIFIYNLLDSPKKLRKSLLNLLVSPKKLRKTLSNLLDSPKNLRKYISLIY